MKALFQQYARYNLWAHSRLIERLLTIPAEKQEQEIPSSFSSLYKMFFHLWSVEEIWWQRLQTGQILIEEDPFKHDIRELGDALLRKSQDWIDWIDGLQEEFLLSDCSYKSLRGESFVQPYFQIFQHIFNHASYHRGQVVTMFHQLDIEKIPATDFILWARENKS